MQQFDFSLFQSLNGSAPFRFMSAHPTEPLVALQAFLDWQQTLQTRTISRTHMRCAIWNRETYELVSEPEGAVALTWNAEGNEMGMVREYYHKPSTYDSETLSTFSYVWERYSWPEQKLLHSCRLPCSNSPTAATLMVDTSWPEFVVFSPLGDLAVVQWFETEKSGLNFISLTKHGDTLLDDDDMPLIEREGDVSEDEDQDEYAEDEYDDEYAEVEDRRFFVETSLTTSPVFSPDGRFIIFCWQESQHWWTDVPDDVYVEGDLPARVGECHVGYAQVIDGANNTTYSIELSANVPPGWQPSYDGDRSNELLNEPVFIDNGHFQVQLPTGETEVYNVLND